jgi:hypothetical protein
MDQNNKHFLVPGELPSLVYNSNPIQILTAAFRLCLGSIENSLRTNESKMARKQVHEGVELRYEGGRIQLRNTSPTSIFVQSTNMNQTHQLRHQTVIKIPSGHQVCSYHIIK